MQELKLTKKYQTYPEYKDSGVAWLGKIPSKWDTKKIASVFNFPKEKVTEDMFEPLSVTYEGIKKQIENAAKVAEGAQRKLVRVGDIAINGRSDRKGAVGVSEFEGGVSLVYNVLRKRRAETDTKYFHYLMRSTLFSEEFYRWGRGIVDDLWTTRESEMKRIFVAVPDYPEQRKIVAYLDEKTALIDQIIEKKKRLIELLREKRAAVINHAVTKGLDPNVELVDSGVEWIGRIPKGWNVEKLKFFSEISLGKMLQSVDSPGDSLKPYLRAQNIRWGYIDVSDVKQMWLSSDELKKHRLLKGDLLVCEGGEVGRTAIWNAELDECYVQNSINRVTVSPRRMNPEFLLYSFEFLGHLGVFDLLVNRVSIAHLTTEKLKEIFFAFPLREDQDEIALYLNERSGLINYSISKIEESIDALTEFKSSLISHVVTGKVKV